MGNSGAAYFPMFEFRVVSHVYPMRLGMSFRGTRMQLPTLLAGLARPVTRAPFVLVAAGLLSVSISAQAQTDSQQVQKTNILLIVGDDVGRGAAPARQAICLVQRR
ncbi:hypothetical protein G3N95_05080 [Paraburkholderia sp. Tr-20389]|uniref:hypothetical protein n=1 Tax=Paraburkholderia sp. Tr-20389 TaxID=2703903 RepID=UPI00197CFF99|nr:hypothetical protein [Paraburkholderia sp. Tr-20389]MBN3752301.1 hypothetical protein [Paraburkholderia sp. Tr-20389]